MQCERVSFWLGLAAVAAVAGFNNSAVQAAAPAGAAEAEPVAASSAEAQAEEATAEFREVVRPSGLRYQVLVPAEGPSPKATDAVVVHYEGRLVDGTVFDSSYDRRLPTNFRLDEVIPGWTEALQLMSPGAKWRLTIPPELAYGDQGVGELIGPGATLIFDVELLDFEESQPFDVQSIDLEEAQPTEAEQTTTP